MTNQLAVGSVAALVVLATPLAGATPDQLSFLGRLEPIQPPQEVAGSSDVRWLAEGELLLGVTGEGVYTWRIGQQNADLYTTLSGTGLVRLGRTQDYSRLGGVSSDGFAFAGLLFGTYFRGAAGTTRTHPAEFVADLDRRGPFTVAVGLNRNGVGGWESRVAWLMKDGEGEPKGLLPSRDEGQGMDWCGLAELSVVRFISLSRILIIPGAERGAFVYGLDGALLETLEAADFLADDGCDVGSQQRHLLADADYRTAWLSERRVVDEVVADEAGNVYFFVRHVSGDVPTPTPVVTSADGGSIVVRGLSGGNRVLAGEEAERLVELLRASGGSSDSEPVSLKPAVAVELLGAAIRPAAATDLSSSTGPVTGSAKLCWDLVHARANNLRDVTVKPCAIESVRMDQRLRADLRETKLAVLLRGGEITATGDGSTSEMFVASLVPPSEQ